MINSEVIEGLLGVSGMLAVALTAILRRDPVKEVLGKFGELRENYETRITERVTQIEATVDYVKTRLNGLEEILCDGVVTPSEVTQMKDEVIELKNKLGNIVNRK